MRVGYGKIGRVVELDVRKWGESGGDNEPVSLLLNLAQRHPDVTWVCIGRNSGWTPPLPNIENPWQKWKTEVKQGVTTKSDAMDHVVRLDAVTRDTIASLDGQLLWIGQHGTSNSPIPKVSDRSQLTSPQISFVHYSSFLLRGLNVWRRDNPLGREEIYLLPDVRNYIKARDLKWGRRYPILSQFNWHREEWVERYGDPRTPAECGFQGKMLDGKWKVIDHYIGSGLELVGIPDVREMPSIDDRPHHFGILINEARNYGMRYELTRLHAMEHYVRPLNPAWVHGTWTDASLQKYGSPIRPIPYDQIFDLFSKTRSTFTTPSSGSGWATAKPWECFSTGVICFFHPQYDTQGLIIPTLNNADDSDLGNLARWLRVTSPADLQAKVNAVTSSDATYKWLASVQWNHYRKAMEEQRCVRTIESRLGLTASSSPGDVLHV